MVGTLRFTHPTDLRSRGRLPYACPASFDSMRTIKRALDPKNIMNPGKNAAI